METSALQLFGHVFATNALKLFFLFTPFFALSMFLCLTAERTDAERRRVAGQALGAAFLICVILLFLGKALFTIFGVTLNAFRAGVGTILLLSGIGLVKGRPVEAKVQPDDDIAIVPMALPVIVGPATIGAVMVMGTELRTAVEKFACVLAMAAAATALWAMLCLATALERRFGRRVFEVLSKVTGLILSALAAQLILGGVRDFMLQ